MIENKNKKIGVIVGRFQTPFLTRGHINLIKEVLKENESIFIILGNTVNSRIDNKNPFSSSYRKELISYHFQKYKDRIKFGTIEDIPDNDKLWSIFLDHNITGVATGYNMIEKDTDFDNYTLYGSRDSFIQYYTGAFPTKIIEPTIEISATEIRDKYLQIIE
jgi:bifunctional NMN adenylyltransferase/nudix hydrolase